MYRKLKAFRFVKFQIIRNDSEDSIHCKYLMKLREVILEIVRFIMLCQYVVDVFRFIQYYKAIIRL